MKIISEKSVTETEKSEEAEKESKKSGDADDSDSCSEDEYVVEKIIKKRIVQGKPEYFIKWKDWPASTNTWEPLENLHCPEKVDEFESKLAEAKAEKAASKKKVCLQVSAKVIKECH